MGLLRPTPTERNDRSIDDPSVQQAFTLLELLIALTISVILLTIGAPGLAHLVQDLRADTLQRELRHTLHLTRTLAIEQRRVITVCGSVDGTACDNDWGRGDWLVFEDRNRNHRYEPDKDRLHWTVPAPAPEGLLRWRASGGRSYLRYTQRGYAMEFGRLTWCPADRNARHARQLVINRPGRARVARDTDGDGALDGREGKPVRCPEPRDD